VLIVVMCVILDQPIVNGLAYHIEF
jgi:hypothetical protein